MLTITSSTPLALQLDGDYCGAQERVTFRNVPNALTVVA
jgi:diacylglycerol kinase family enzyme